MTDCKRGHNYTCFLMSMLFTEWLCRSFLKRRRLLPYSLNSSWCSDLLWPRDRQSNVILLPSFRLKRPCTSLLTFLDSCSLHINKTMLVSWKMTDQIQQSQSGSSSQLRPKTYERSICCLAAAGVSELRKWDQDLWKWGISWLVSLGREMHNEA